MKTQKLDHQLTNLPTFLPIPRGKLWGSDVADKNEGVGAVAKKIGQPCFKDLSTSANNSDEEGCPIFSRHIPDSVLGILAANKRSLKEDCPHFYAGKPWLHKVLLGKEGDAYVQKNGVPVCWQWHHHVAGLDWFGLNKIQFPQSNKWLKEDNNKNKILCTTCNIIPYVKQLRQLNLVKFDEHLVLLQEVQL